jgi:hypothetical protein
MIAVNASTSPHSSVNFTPFGSDALTFAGEEKGAALFDADPHTPSQAPGKSIACCSAVARPDRTCFQSEPG